MPFIRNPKGWEISENEVTSEDACVNRRRFLKGAGVVGAGVAIGVAGPKLLAAKSERKLNALNARRNEKYKVKRVLTAESIATNYNNFYEFTEQKTLVKELAKDFPNRPWKVEVGGLVNKPRTFDIDDIMKEFNQEERIYRFRCVEAWAMTVPWIGFPFSELIKKVEPKKEAKFVRLLSFNNPKVAPNQRKKSYPWPYFEGLTLAEAMNELTMLVTGLYGKELPPQNGAPIRLIVPWKYGFKSAKSVVKIEFTDSQPPTFWNQLIPNEYDFWSNVNPKVPHPRWSQASERLIGTRERVPTLLYNGYEKFVSGLYKKT